ncbi:hypothetical protein WISP_107891 [Willisornis vidua]|uniref:Uncharacterized protein n=1 Tax=Willisornis vidua TaxID=1566151 RepID=A0ABQ9D1F1_9PASS|nr:hypothetical protein WISP_107891 [Willisornis vidua]
MVQTSGHRLGSNNINDEIAQEVCSLEKWEYYLVLSSDLIELGQSERPNSYEQISKGKHTAMYKLFLPDTLVFTGGIRKEEQHGPYKFPNRKCRSLSWLYVISQKETVANVYNKSYQHKLDSLMDMKPGPHIRSNVNTKNTCAFVQSYGHLYYLFPKTHDPFPYAINFTGSGNNAPGHFLNTPQLKWVFFRILNNLPCKAETTVVNNTFLATLPFDLNTESEKQSSLYHWLQRTHSRENVKDTMNGI